MEGWAALQPLGWGNDSVGSRRAGGQGFTEELKNLLRLGCVAAYDGQGDTGGMNGWDACKAGQAPGVSGSIYGGSDLGNLAS